MIKVVILNCEKLMKLNLLFTILLNYKFNPDSYRESKRHYKCRLAGGSLSRLS